MSDHVDNAERLREECAVFCHHLVGTRPDTTILERYVASHSARPDLFACGGGFESALLRFASAGSARTRLADTYCSFLAPASLLRRKLALLTAILESTASTFEVFETPTVRSATHWWLAMSWKGAVFAATLLAAVFVLGPMHLALRSRTETPAPSTPSKTPG